MNERLGIIGGGTIASGLAALATNHGDVLMVARSPEKARANVDKVCSRLGDEYDAARVTITTDLEALSEATLIVEAIAEDLAVKHELYPKIPHGENTILATTTSSLPIETLAEEAHHKGRFLGMHVFNPVPRMKLVELVFPKDTTDETKQRARDVCETLGKTAVEVPDVPGFVVNRLLFPYLFSAVRFMEETGMDAKDIDTCMTLGAGHPMGPLALLDLVGLDVSKAIGEEIGAEIPETVSKLVAEGKLGRKSGAGLTL